jgi:hypothetical protein
MVNVNRVAIVASKQSYRVRDFLKAASLLRIDSVVATNAPLLLPESRQIQIDLEDPDSAASAIAALRPRPDAVVATDDQGVVIAAEAAALLGLKHNAPAAVRATREKLAMRRLLSAAGVRQPRWAAASPGEVANAANKLGYPVVIKPRGLSASRGVIRADGPEAAARAEHRVRAILSQAGRYPEARLLVEEYVPGVEVAVEGLLIDGELEILAIIDKPGPLTGPFFEETLYVTPSRLGDHIQVAIGELVAAAAVAIGLTSGPIHAEARIPESGEPVLIELAARSIGGLCSRAFTFGLPNESLEVMILRSALGLPTVDTSAAKPATGVLMLPIPATGILTDVEGVSDVLAMDGIDGVEITIPTGRRVVALPEGDRYVGFVFASGLDPGAVEATLRRAGTALILSIDGEDIRPSVDAGPPN